MASVKTKRPLAPRTNDVDRLAKKLASGLKISDAATTRARKGARNVQTSKVAESPEESRMAAMRSINLALQSLASAVSRKSSSTRAAVSVSASTGRSTLNTLRKLSPELLDVERAALSLAVKLLALDMHSEALDVLADVQAHLPSYYSHAEARSSTSSRLPLSALQLPLPTSSLDPTIQASISTYFTHALSAVSRAVSSMPTLYDAFCKSLDGPACLRFWVPHLTALPSKALDALLKRSYVTLTSSHTSPPASLLHVLKIRFYALRVLLLSTELDITQFWEQCLKYAASYARNKEAKESENAKIAALLSCFAGLENVATRRQEGKGWIAFCEYWLALAKRSGDVTLLNRVAAYISNAASSSDDLSLLATRACAVLTQLAVSLDHIQDSQRADDEQLVANAKSTISCLCDLHVLPAPEKSLDSKLWRALDKCRRSCLKSINRPRTSPREWDTVKRVLESIVGILETFLDADATISALDTLFQLATAGLAPQNADTCDQAYNHLVRAARIIEQTPAGSVVEKRARADYTRCLSGAFANVAGTLYKAERHSFAVRFLLQACPLSARASVLYDESRAMNTEVEADGKGKARDEPESDKNREGWSSHKSQVYRRWELLGVCYSRIGERKLAFDAFVQGVISFPFEDGLPPSAMNSTGNLGLELSSEAFRPLTAAIDRLTHLGSAELHLKASNISLLTPLVARGVPPLTICAVLMRQVFTLAEGGCRAKSSVRVVTGALLRDLLSIYEPVRFPIRRVRVLVLVLEHEYYGGDANTEPNQFRVGEIGQEVQKLLSVGNNLHDDSTLVHFRLYYRVMALLWVVLHAHRAADPVQIVLQHAHAALDSLGALVTQLFEEPGSTGTKEGASVGRGRRVGRGKVDEAKSAGAREKVRTTRSQTRLQTQPAPKTRVGRSASVRKPPVTPKVVGTETKSVVSLPAILAHGPSATELVTLTRLMLMVAELLGLSGLVLAKMQTLILARRLLEEAGDLTGEAYLQTSAILAHELAKLGKTSQAIGILAPLASALNVSSLSSLPSPAGVILLLRYAEALAVGGDFSKSIAVYEEASRLCEILPDEEKEKGMSTSARIHTRVIALERTAVAAGVFATIQDAKDDSGASLKALLQSLRLLNRATETLSRLNPSKKSESSSDTSDPFATSDLKDALPIVNGDAGKQSPDKTSEQKSAQQRSCLEGLEWRIANTLLDVMLGLAYTYEDRGSAREAEYFAQQAEDLARVLHAPAMTARALLRKSEIQILLGQAEEAHKALAEAAGLVESVQGLELDVVDVRRLKGDQLLRRTQETDAQDEYAEATRLLTELSLSFGQFDSLVATRSPKESKGAFVPVLQAAILKQHVWLLRDELDEDYERHLEQLLVLPQLSRVEVHVNSLLGRLALYDIHERFRSDMSLSSLAESTIALPMGMTSENSVLYSPPQDILEALEQADEHFTSELSRFAERDSVVNVRSAAVAAALVNTYQASLGRTSQYSPLFASNLLDMASSVTLRRELMDAISFKFPDPKSQDDLLWPSENPVSSHLHRKLSTNPMARGLFDDFRDDEDEYISLDDGGLRKYWDHVLKKHQSQAFIPPEDSASKIDSLPENWMVVSITLTEDKSALLVSRQRPHNEPIIFCVPLRGRRDNDEDEHFTFDDAMAELKDIIQTSDEGTRRASQIKSDDKEGKVAWWAQRKQLNQRMKELVENIEFCWLGAFKTILSQPMRMPPDIIPGLRTRFEKVFRTILGSHEKKSQRAKLKLETNLLELFSTLPSTCRDEELEDLVYFVLDLYHFHGLPIALSEVDVDEVVVNLRTALEEHHTRARGRIVPEPDAHTFLVLDKNVQTIPWESLPILRGTSVSRVPSLAFITDRLALARCQRGLPLEPEAADGDEDSVKVDRAPVDPSKGYFVLNPGGDLTGTEGRFKGWVNDLRKVGWEGIIGHAPSEQQFLNALSRKDLVVYFGHGGAEQYMRSHKVRHLQRCAVTMLWGCSSGALRDMGDFDRTGTPYNYMLAGCPSLVANLWDVTDRDIDKFALAVFNKLRLEPAEVGKWQSGKRGPQDGKISVVAAVAQSRDACKLKYLTGAAVVVYGIPFYL